MRKRNNYYIMFFILGILSLGYLFFFPASSLYSCSTFCMDKDNQLIFGRNYDWDVDSGCVFVNKKNIKKTAFVPPLSGTPVEWVSQYGSITFNQYGKEFPLGGMNEAGLVVEVMWLRATEYPEPDERPVLGELAWVQYQLDNHKTVDQVIASDKTIRISNSQAKIHFLVCDSRGHSVTVEFLNGEMNYHTGNKLPVKVLTNSTYERSLQYLRYHTGFGGTRKISSGSGSMERFTNIAAMIKDYQTKTNGPAVPYGFNVLKAVTVPRTLWTIVYDVKNLEIHYKTRKYPKIRSVRIKDFTYSCKTPSKFIDINSPGKGNISNDFETYTTEANLRFISEAFRRTHFLQNIPASIINMYAKYPETLICQ